MSSKNENKVTVSGGGCGCFGGVFSVGGILAFIISWKLFHAFGWALLAAFFGWGYVLYAAIFYLPQIMAMLG
jgi:hypothetical protein